MYTVRMHTHVQPGINSEKLPSPFSTLFFFFETKSLTKPRASKLTKTAGRKNPLGPPVSASQCWDYRCTLAQMACYMGTRDVISGSCACLEST